MLNKTRVAFGEQVNSTRFLIVQEGILIVVLASVTKMLMPTFPLETLIAFLGPVVLGAYGFKTYENIKGGEANETSVRVEKGLVEISNRTTDPDDLLLQRPNL